MSISSGRTILVQGRIVWTIGDLFKGRIKTDMQTKQPIVDPKTGLHKIEFGFGLAVPKSSLNQAGPGQPGEIWTAIHEEAMSLYPTKNIPPSFAMKYKDGDGIDDLGVPFSQRDGYAGCLVFACTTNLPIKFFKFENNQNFMINEGIKCGDYVNVQLSIKAHSAVGQGKPGLYLNPNAVQFLGYGKEIVNTPSGDQVFGTKAPPLPPGASLTPLAPQGMIVPPSGVQQPPVAPNGLQNMVYPGTTQQAYPQFAPQQPQAPMAPPMPQAPIQPNWGVLPQSHQPQQAYPQFAPQQPQAPMAPPMPQMSGMPMPGLPPQFDPNQNVPF